VIIFSTKSPESTWVFNPPGKPKSSLINSQNYVILLPVQMSAEHIPATFSDVAIPDVIAYPYTPENFSGEEKKALSKFFTNIDKPVFAVKNLPQEVVGAMFSRYSRSAKSVRRLFLDEFWSSEDLGIQNIADYLTEESEDTLEKAQERARKFYQRVFAEYGDDSVIQMGSVHIAFEGVSQIAAKAIEDQRVGAAYIEKSTRYVSFTDKENGRYLYMDVPEIIESELLDEYLGWNDRSFELYAESIPPMKKHLREKYPIGQEVFINPSTGEEVSYSKIDSDKERSLAERAYNRALHAKTLDTVRVFLPTTTVTNLGAHLSGQAAENMINKMLASGYLEVRVLGTMAYAELVQIAPNFLQNVDSHHGSSIRGYKQKLAEQSREAVAKWLNEHPAESIKKNHKVRIVSVDPDADINIAAQIIYTNQKEQKSSMEEIKQSLRSIKSKDALTGLGRRYSEKISRLIIDSVSDRASQGRNRRHKLPRGFEHAFAEVEFYCDFGIFRDLQRNRMSSTERQPLNADEVYVPPEFNESGMEEVREAYLKHAEWTKNLHSKVNEGAEYVTLFGNMMRFNVKANMRQWAFFAELRTISGGHPTYRWAMQNAARQIQTVIPFMKPLFAHVDWRKNYGLGRLKAEVKTQQKLSELGK